MTTKMVPSEALPTRGLRLRFDYELHVHISCKWKTVLRQSDEVVFSNRDLNSTK